MGFKGIFKTMTEAENSEYIYQWKEKWIIITDHAVQRDYERMEISKEEKEEYFKKCVKALSVKGKGKYLVYSKSLNHGMVFDYRKDYKNPEDKKLHLIITTIFPKFQHYAKQGTVKIMVEAFKSYMNPEGKFSDEFSKWITGVLEVPLTEGKGIDVKTIEKFNEEWTLVYVDNKLDAISSFGDDYKIEIMEID